LSESHKNTIKEAAHAVEKKLRDDIIEIEVGDYRFAREKGMKVYDLAPDDVTEWRACSAPVLDAFMTDTGELAQKLMGAYGKLRIDPCCNSGPEGAFTRR
jgi:TRAP-type C4-dicarboxylate transport system substrate-binding protein